MVIPNNLYSQFQQNRIINNTEENSKNNNVANGHAINTSNAYQQYQKNMVTTASPQELTLMLYNGLIKFLNLSIQAIEEKSIEKANNNILRSQDIIQEFMSTLDMDYEVSNGLFALYDYMNRRLIDANIQKDKAILEEVLGFAEDLRDTWAQAMKLAKQPQVANK
jgi:flagellar protein FliS